MTQYCLIPIVLSCMVFLSGCGSSSSAGSSEPEEALTTTEPPIALSCDQGLTNEPIRCEPGFMLAGVEFSERYVTAGDIEWHVVEAGDVAAPTILFLHGVPESWYDWHRQMIDLASDYHVIAFDLKGFGRSDHPNADEAVGSGFYSASRVATEVALLMDALGLNSAVTLVSHDWGTLIASYLVFEQDTRFSAWARMSAPLGGDGQEIVDLNTQFALFQDHNRCQTVFSREQFIFSLYGYDGELGLNSSQPIANEVVDRINEEWRFDERTPNTACKYYSDTPEITNPHFWSSTIIEMMSAISFPVYLIQAVDDERQPLSLFDNTIADLPPGIATLYPVPDSGHFMMSEQPDSVTMAILELIDAAKFF
jgi:pimeloyl-ACP methyl ester carboxylesterase